MALLLKLAGLALKGAVDGAGKAVGIKSPQAIIALLREHFTDHSQQLAQALYHCETASLTNVQDTNSVGRINAELSFSGTTDEDISVYMCRDRRGNVTAQL